MEQKELDSIAFGFKAKDQVIIMGEDGKICSNWFNSTVNSQSSIE